MQRQVPFPGKPFSFGSVSGNVCRATRVEPLRGARALRRHHKAIGLTDTESRLSGSRKAAAIAGAMTTTRATGFVRLESWRSRFRQLDAD